MTAPTLTARWRVAALTLAVGASCSSTGTYVETQVGAGTPFTPGEKCAYAFTRSTQAAGATWERTGPPGGAVTALLALSGGGLVAGTGYSSAPSGLRGPQTAGLYRSTDGGATFAQVAALKDASVAALVVSSDGSTVFAAVASQSGSGDDGVWTSTNGGLSFAAANQGLHTGARVVALAVSPGAPERVFALVSGTSDDPLSLKASLYRRDGGGDWTSLAMAGADAPTVGGPIHALVADTSDRERVYLSNDAVFYASVNGGADFTATPYGNQTFAPNGSLWIRALHADPADSSRLVLSTHEDGLFESRNRGASWVHTGLAKMGVRDIGFAGAKAFVGTNGSGLQALAGGAFEKTGRCLVDPVVSSVAVAPDDPSKVFVGTPGGGVSRSNDGGASFFPPSPGIEELLARVAVTGTAGAPVVWLMSGAGLFRSTDRGGRWERVAEDAGAFTVWSVAQDPADATKVLLGTSAERFEGGGEGLGVLSLKTDTMTLSAAEGLAGRNVAAVAFVPAQANRAVAYQCRSVDDAADVANGVAPSVTGGASFGQLGFTAPDCGFESSPLAVGPDGTVWAAALDSEMGPGALWRSDDAGIAFSRIYTVPDGWVGMGVWADAAGNVFLGGWYTGVGLLRSTNRGVSFDAFGTGLADMAVFVSDLAFGPSGGILAATEGGARWAADGTAFAALDEGLPTGISVQSVAIAPGSPAVAFAATKQGVFRRTLP